ncbi:CGNR zinc finger domain-containing protein [Tahibacter harae]|uniref:CGNR zinc finger domain-containing protein n=1 Tax=Tahibacter harae TaxID=2963937 RepID=A0ABT1QQB7_9GAMM|nr:CGNR zinc finger domain-containing protein [Tahibacter harae]MCQ4164468.1 CGNR zinc finger domain-containing protein [Tahibacter harae]
MQTEPHAFRAADLVAGEFALDLVNTVTARDSRPRDWLADYAALLDWAGHSGVFAAAELRQLDALARRQPLKARAALVRIKRLREALCVLAYALGGQPAGAAAERAALAQLDAARRAAAQAARLVRQPQGLAQEWTAQRSGLDLIAHVAAARAVVSLQQLELARLRICAGHDCGWVFLDTSKSGRRRWCDMATCGNSAKAQRFQQAQRARRGKAA